MACNNGNDPVWREKGENARTIAPRLSNAEWKKCCVPAAAQPSCSDRINDRNEALELLTVATGKCLDNVMKAVERHSPEDLSAAYYIRAQRNDDPVDFLRALQAAENTLREKPSSHAARFNRALLYQKLGLTREAQFAWNEIDDDSEWTREARQRLHSMPEQANLESIYKTLRRRDDAAMKRIVRTVPQSAQRWFEDEADLTSGASKPLADALYERGDPYARTILEHPSEEGVLLYRRARALDRDVALDEAEKMYEQAAAVLERAGNPLSLSARYCIASIQFRSQRDPLPVLDAIIPIATRGGYRELAARIHTLRGTALMFADDYLEALDAYKQALDFAKGDPSNTVAALSRRSGLYTVLGDSRNAFRDALATFSSVTAVADVSAVHNAQGAAATAARTFGYPEIALRYQHAAVKFVQRAVAETDSIVAKQHYAIALRERANLHFQLQHDEAAREDLEQAVRLAEAIDKKELHAQLRMRVQEVSGQALLDDNPAEAIRRFDEAIPLATGESSTYRAVLYFKRAAARRKARDPRADDDMAIALEILRREAVSLLDQHTRGTFEDLWTPYFSRFQSMYHDMIESRIAEKDIQGAFLYAEQARAFEPMQLLLQSKSVPRGFRKIETKSDLQAALATLPDDTWILQYLVLEDRAYVWVLSRGRITLVPLRAGRASIERWLTEATDAAMVHGQNDEFRGAMRSAYAALFRAPMAMLPQSKAVRIVIVPDGAMHGIPFAALEGTRKEGLVVERGSIAVAASTSLYLYALARDRELPANNDVRALIVGDPRFDPRLPYKQLPSAREEAEHLGTIYPGATVLLDKEPTVARFLAEAKGAGLIHVGGHGLVSPQKPWHSRLLLAAYDKDSGELTAEELMRALPELPHTRLVVLGACSTAGGQSIGPEGLAPLVRPIVAARVPAIVGTLWDVGDATAKNLLVSFHCHYRHGDDVAVALRHAQLEMSRNKTPARLWAPYEVIGYTRSPYERPATLEETHSEHVCTQNSLHRPDGLHPE
jgi:CHAT domain-containing protein